MKKILVICFLGVLLLTSCGLTEEEKQCLDDIKAGLQARWDITNEQGNTFKEQREILEKATVVDLEQVSKYGDNSFKDEELSGIVSKYVEAVRNQSEGIKYYYEDPQKYNSLYINKGMKVRADCIKQLQDNYDFEVDDKYKDNIKSLLEGVKGEALGLNKRVEVSTSYGKVAITLNGFVYETTTYTAISDKQKRAMLLCTVENISYNDTYNPGFVDLTQFLGVFDGAGYDIRTDDVSNNYKQYDACAGGFAPLSVGRKARFAVDYNMPKYMKMVKVVIGGNNYSYETFINVKKKNTKI